MEIICPTYKISSMYTKTIRDSVTCFTILSAAILHRLKNNRKIPNWTHIMKVYNLPHINIKTNTGKMLLV